MAAALPIKTTAEDIIFLAEYLKAQVGFVPLERLRAAVPAPHGDARKIDAMRFLGLIEVNSSGVKLTDDGRIYAAGSANERATVLAGRLRSIPLFSATLDWMHYSKVRMPAKTDIANYWVDKHSGEVSGSKGAALTDAAVLFLRIAGAAGAGKFVAAGAGRETHLKVDPDALEAIVTGAAPVAAATPPAAVGAAPGRPPMKLSEGAGNGSADVTLSPGININIEIHIAADAKAATIEEIFKNMRKYVLNRSGDEAVE